VQWYAGLAECEHDCRLRAGSDFRKFCFLSLYRDFAFAVENSPELPALRARRRGMQDGAILAGVQMAPFPFGLMIVERAEATAFRTSPLRVVLMGEVDVYLPLLKLQFYSLHLPRSFNTEDASIEFVILHSMMFS